MVVELGPIQPDLWDGEGEDLKSPLFLTIWGAPVATRRVRCLAEVDYGQMASKHDYHLEWGGLSLGFHAGGHGVLGLF